MGNEDNLDREAGSLEGRFAQFYDAIRANYPPLKILSSTSAPGRIPDIIDEHYECRSEDEMASHAHDFDTRPRSAPWIVRMERNSDLVVMSS